MSDGMDSTVVLKGARAALDGGPDQSRGKFCRRCLD